MEPNELDDALLGDEDGDLEDEAALDATEDEDAGMDDRRFLEFINRRPTRPRQIDPRPF
jgi:hypothetical protein